MQSIEFSVSEKEAIIQKVKMYFHEELNQEIGQFDAEFLMDFFMKEVGVFAYNRGVYDAQALLASKIEDIADVIYELEQPTQ